MKIIIIYNHRVHREITECTEKLHELAKFNFLNLNYQEVQGTPNRLYDFVLYFNLT